MRRFRNPRYAPESLERKLSPSGVSLPVTAEFATVIPGTTEAPATAEVTGSTAFNAATEPPPVPDPLDPLSPDPIPSPGEPPSGGPSNPKGPGEPD